MEDHSCRKAVYFLTALLILLASAILMLAGRDASAQSVEDYGDKRKKVALTIGISRYARERTLLNPSRDVLAVSRRLDEVGFETTKVENVTVAEAREAISAFTATAKDADIALVYYSGHGLQISGENYIVPRDFDPSKGEVVEQLISITRLMEDLNPIAKAKIVLLDACRENPFLPEIAKATRTKSLTRGFAPIKVEIPATQTSSSAYGLIVGYATQPNDTADDGEGTLSPYATGLLQAMVAPDEDLSTILVKAARTVVSQTNGRQRPEHRVALTQPLFLVARAKPLLCDVLAAETDNNVSVKGVEFDRIDVAAATSACRADLEREPANPRLVHNLARTLDKGGEKAQAVELYKRAAMLGFDWSQNNLAVMYLNGEGVEPDFAEAMLWMRKAYAQGNRQAAINYADTDMWTILDDSPARIVHLQSALIRAGFLAGPPGGRLDEATRDALLRFKASKGLRGHGITFQDMDALGITADVLRRETAGSK